MYSSEVLVYTIGLKDLTFEEAIIWADLNSVSALQIRGCERGYDLRSLSSCALLEIQEKIKKSCVKIDSVAVDIELEEVSNAFVFSRLTDYVNVVKALNCRKIRIVVKKWRAGASLEHIVRAIRAIDICVLIEFHCAECLEAAELKRITRGLSGEKNVSYLIDLDQFVRNKVCLDSLGSVFYENVDMIHLDTKKYYGKIYDEMLSYLAKRRELFRACVENWREPSSHVTRNKFLEIRSEIMKYSRDSL